MATIDSLKASNGAGNAASPIIQSVRAPLATTLVVNTVQNINTTFHATMGTPHTFVDPVTGESITVISEATAVDFVGHVDGGNLEIDTIAPGFVDNGSQVGDIVIIKPTTQWANSAAEVLEVAHKDDGTLEDDSVGTDTIADEAVTTPKIADGAVTPEKRSGGFFTAVLVTNSTGAKQVTGIGFTPKFAMFIGTISNSDATASISVATWDGTTVGGAAVAARPNSSNSAASRTRVGSSNIGNIAISSSGSTTTYTDVTPNSFGNGTFDYTVNTAEGGASITAIFWG